MSIHYLRYIGFRYPTAISGELLDRFCYASHKLITGFFVAGSGRTPNAKHVEPPSRHAQSLKFLRQRLLSSI
jgi:hypothetical protein